MARFFLDRPVFAWVVAIGMMLAGGLAIYNLPISQYPLIRSYGSGIEVYRLTRTGLALGATAAGTKFWKHDSLN